VVFRRQLSSRRCGFPSDVIISRVRYELARNRARGLLTLTRQPPPIDIEAIIDLAGVPVVPSSMGSEGPSAMLQASARSFSSEVLFCHSTPRSEMEIFTRLNPEDRLLPLFEGLEGSVVVCGHTHMQFDRMIGRTRVVNAGSVGMPFGDPGRLLGLAGTRRSIAADAVRSHEGG
jgi:diadenosine tetraphosphatase ApaH/serine/threonine PP2A family protein phosphatase